ncbi:Retrovirus-related Pol polyprotein from type-1 retrotransposable element R2 [Nymphon striatum]|nr:Retrovirus-related Pol polyprotein from type-1 retrotransposable element R2 [Nymphon striatum]
MEVLFPIGQKIENPRGESPSLYWKQNTRIRTEIGLSEPVHIKRGVRQGCPSLFNLYTEHIFREIEMIPGILVGGTIINNFRYADDTVILADNEEDLKNLVSIIKKKSEEVGLKMNVKKTKAIVLTNKQVPPKV